MDDSIIMGQFRSRDSIIARNDSEFRNLWGKKLSLEGYRSHLVRLSTNGLTFGHFILMDYAYGTQWHLFQLTLDKLRLKRIFLLIRKEWVSKIRVMTWPDLSRVDVENERKARRWKDHYWGGGCTSMLGWGGVAGATRQGTPDESLCVGIRMILQRMEGGPFSVGESPITVVPFQPKL